MAIPSSYPMIPKLAVVILLALPQAGVSEELATTQGLLPEGLTESRDYEVWVDGRRQQVLETRKTTNHGTHNIERMSFVGFDADAETQVQLKVQRPFRTYEVRPRRTDFRLSRDGHVLTLSLQPGQQATVLFDGGYDHALIIAANPRQIAPQPSDVQHFFAPGVHRLAKRLPLRSGDRGAGNSRRRNRVSPNSFRSRRIRQQC